MQPSGGDDRGGKGTSAPATARRMPGPGSPPSARRPTRRVSLSFISPDSGRAVPERDDPETDDDDGPFGDGVVTFTGVSHNSGRAPPGGNAVLGIPAPDPEHVAAAIRASMTPAMAAAIPARSARRQMTEARQRAKNTAARNLMLRYGVAHTIRGRASSVGDAHHLRVKLAVSEMEPRAVANSLLQLLGAQATATAAVASKRKGKGAEPPGAAPSARDAAALLETYFPPPDPASAAGLEAVRKDARERKRRARRWEAMAFGGDYCVCSSEEEGSSETGSESSDEPDLDAAIGPVPFREIIHRSLRRLGHLDEAAVARRDARRSQGQQLSRLQRAFFRAAAREMLPAPHSSDRPSHERAQEEEEARRRRTNRRRSSLQWGASRQRHALEAAAEQFLAKLSPEERSRLPLSFDSLFDVLERLFFGQAGDRSPRAVTPANRCLSVTSDPATPSIAHTPWRRKPSGLRLPSFAAHEAGDDAGLASVGSTSLQHDNDTATPPHETPPHHRTRRALSRTMSSASSSHGSDDGTPESFAVGRRATGAGRSRRATFLTPQDRDARGRYPAWHTQPFAEQTHNAPGAYAARRAMVLALFRAVDHDGTGRIPWQRFYAYLLDSSLIGRVGHVALGRRLDFEAATVLSHKERPELFGGVACVHQPSPGTVLVVARGGAFVAKTQPLGLPVRIAVDDSVEGMGAPSDTSQPGLGKHKTVAANVNHAGARKTYGAALEERAVAGAYLEQFGIVALAFADSTLRLYATVGRRPKLLEHLGFDCNLTAMLWYPVRDTLFVGARNGSLVAFRVDPTAAAVGGSLLTEIKATRPHSDFVSSIAGLSTEGSILSTGFDKRIVLHDAKTLREVQVLVGHPSAVCKAVYSPKFNIVVTVAFDPVPLVWFLNVAAKPPLPLQDTSQHVGKLCDVVLLEEDRSACATLDVRGMLKVWCLKFFVPKQTFNAAAVLPGQVRVPEFVGMAFYSEPATEAEPLGTSRLVCFTANHGAPVLEVNARQKRLAVKNTADDDVIVAAFSLPALDAVMTVSTLGVKVWDRATTVLRDHFVHDEFKARGGISAAGIHPVHQRMFAVGTRDGSLLLHSTSSGGLVAAYMQLHAVPGDIHDATHAAIIGIQFLAPPAGDADEGTGGVPPAMDDRPAAHERRGTARRGHSQAQYVVTISDSMLCVPRLLACASQFDDGPARVTFRVPLRSVELLREAGLLAVTTGGGVSLFSIGRLMSTASMHSPLAVVQPPDLRRRRAAAPANHAAHAASLVISRSSRPSSGASPATASPVASPRAGGGAGSGDAQRAAAMGGCDTTAVVSLEALGVMAYADDTGQITLHTTRPPIAPVELETSASLSLDLSCASSVRRASVSSGSFALAPSASPPRDRLTAQRGSPGEARQREALDAGVEAGRRLNDALPPFTPIASWMHTLHAGTTPPSVAVVSWSPSHPTLLYCGDDLGFVTVYDVRPCIDSALEDVAPEPADSPFLTEALVQPLAPRTASSLAAEAQLTPQRNAQRMPRIVNRWRAHLEAVTAVALHIASPTSVHAGATPATACVLVTSGVDQCVHFWSTSGSVALGTFNQHNAMPRPVPPNSDDVWAFAPSDMADLSASRKGQTTAQVLASLSNPPTPPSGPSPARTPTTSLFEPGQTPPPVVLDPAASETGQVLKQGFEGLLRGATRSVSITSPHTTGLIGDPLPAEGARRSLLTSVPPIGSTMVGLPETVSALPDVNLRPRSMTTRGALLLKARDGAGTAAAHFALPPGGEATPGDSPLPELAESDPAAAALPAPATLDPRTSDAQGRGRRVRILSDPDVPMISSMYETGPTAANSPAPLDMLDTTLCLDTPKATPLLPDPSTPAALVTPRLGSPPASPPLSHARPSGTPSSPPALSTAAPSFSGLPPRAPTPQTASGSPRAPSSRAATPQSRSGRFAKVTREERLLDAALDAERPAFPADVLPSSHALPTPSHVRRAPPLTPSRRTPGSLPEADRTVSTLSPSVLTGTRRTKSMVDLLEQRLTQTPQRDTTAFFFDDVDSDEHDGTDGPSSSSSSSCGSTAHAGCDITITTDVVVPELTVTAETAAEAEAVTLVVPEVPTLLPPVATAAPLEQSTEEQGGPEDSPGDGPRDEAPGVEPWEDPRVRIARATAELGPLLPPAQRAIEKAGAVGAVLKTVLFTPPHTNQLTYHPDRGDGRQDPDTRTPLPSPRLPALDPDIEHIAGSAAPPPATAPPSPPPQQSYDPTPQRGVAGVSVPRRRLPTPAQLLGMPPTAHGRRSAPPGDASFTAAPALTVGAGLSGAVERYDPPSQRLPPAAGRPMPHRSRTPGPGSGAVPKRRGRASVPSTVGLDLIARPRPAAAASFNTHGPLVPVGSPGPVGASLLRTGTPGPWGVDTEARRRAATTAATVRTAPTPQRAALTPGPGKHRPLQPLPGGPTAFGSLRGGGLSRR